MIFQNEKPTSKDNKIVVSKNVMSLVVKKKFFFFWCPTRFDTNRAVQPQKMARGLKFRIKIKEGSHYPCSENKGADLHLYFHICKKQFSHSEAHISGEESIK